MPLLICITIGIKDVTHQHVEITSATNSTTLETSYYLQTKNEGSYS